MKKPGLLTVIICSWLLCLSCAKKENNENCNSPGKELAPPVTIESVLRSSNIFLVGKIANVREKDSLSAGLTTVEFGCNYPARVANIVDRKNLFLADPSISEISEVASLSEVCEVIITKVPDCSYEYKEDGGSVEDSDCDRYKEVQVPTCELPQWHYTLPSSDEVESYGIFLQANINNLSDSRTPKLLVILHSRISRLKRSWNELSRGEGRKLGVS